MCKRSKFTFNLIEKNNGVCVLELIVTDGKPQGEKHDIEIFWGKRRTDQTNGIKKTIFTLNNKITTQLGLT